MGSGKRMESIAIIGTGIAGMGAGYFLRGRFDITYYEKNSYPGGHTNTVTIDEDGQPVFIDTGFMVYNEITYPYLTRLFKELDVKTKPTSMSFSVQHCPTGLEYCGTGISGLFAQRKNIFNPRFVRMLLDIDRFNREAIEVLDSERFLSYTIADYIREKGWGEEMLDQYLLPMSSAVWSTTPELMRQFPVVTLARFFKNHGFLGLTTHYQWRTVEGGSKEYRDKILASFKGKIKLNAPVKTVIRERGKIAVVDQNGGKAIYDQVIIAAHADEALPILQTPTPLEQKLLKAFDYQKNRASLHTDDSVMPKTRRAWSSWNYRIQRDPCGELKATTVYYMNNLQQVSKRKNYFVSINDPGEVDSKKILWEMEYTHPIYNVDAMRAQAQLPQLNQDGRIFFCGSYFQYGFHEDALVSALNVARSIAGKGIWE